MRINNQELCTPCMVKRMLASLIAMSCIGAGATSFGTDYSDLWWNAAENGEGFNVIQQGNTLFVTFFVYDSSNKPIWYVGSNVAYVPTASNFQGALYVTQGPIGPSLGVTQVGNATFSPTSATAATLTYTVNGVQIVKTLTRQTWKNDDISGAYIGARVGTYTGCPPPTVNGYGEDPITSVVTLNGQNVTIQTTYTNTGNVCTTTGTYTQVGRMGSLDGSFTCTSGASGTYTGNQFQVSPLGITWQGTAANGSCSWTGHSGGIRQVP